MVPLDPLQAGSTYRSAKLSSIEDAATQLGLKTTKEYRELLEQIRRETQLLEDLRNRQEVQHAQFSSERLSRM